MVEPKTNIEHKWKMYQCWVCGRKFRVYPEDRDELGLRPDACSACKQHVEIEVLQGVSMPGHLYILRQLAFRIELLERSVRHLGEQTGYGGSHGR